MTTAPASAPPGAAEETVARAGTYYRSTRYIFSAVLIGMGCWFAYDGFVTYPRDNELHRLHVQEPALYPADAPTHKPKDIALQKGLAVLLPAVAVALLAWTFYNSRGTYRFDGHTLHVPGHPPVELQYVTQIDKSQWDRKGIAYLTYALPTGATGRARLDDFVYDRHSTDRILERVEAALGVTTDAESTDTAATTAGE